MNLIDLSIARHDLLNISSNISSNHNELSMVYSLVGIIEAFIGSFGKRYSLLFSSRKPIYSAFLSTVTKLGNFLIIIVLLQSGPKKNPLNILLINLCLADSIVSGFVVSSTVIGNKIF